MTPAVAWSVAVILGIVALILGAMWFEEHRMYTAAMSIAERREVMFVKAEARANKLAAQLAAHQEQPAPLTGALIHARAMGFPAAAAPVVGRLGAMLGATGPGGASRAEGESRTDGAVSDPRPMCVPCAARIVIMGGHWQQTRENIDRMCDHCGAFTGHRLAALVQE